MSSILIVTEAFTAGGLETHIRGEIQRLSEQGFNVHLACGEQFSSEFLPSEAASVRSGLRLGPAATLEDLQASVSELRGMIQHGGIDRVHIHPYTSLIPAAIAAEVEGVPSALTVHGPSLTDGTYGQLFDFLLDHVLLPGSGHVFAVSEEIRAVLSPFVDEQRLTVLPNSVAIAGDGSSPAALVDARDGCWLVASRLDRSKLPGVVHFLQLARAVGIPRVEVAGDGPARDELEAALREGALAGLATLIGVKNDLPARMKGYAGVAGMGRVVLESLAAGRPTCLIGYDGVKGLITPTLFRQAAWANFSGRGLPSIGHVQLIQQLDGLAQSSSTDLRALLTPQYDEQTVWNEFSRILTRLDPPAKGFLSELSVWLGVHRRPESLPFLRSPQLGLFIGRLATSPRYRGQGLADSYVHAMCVGAKHTKELALHEVGQRLAQLELETHHLRSTLEVTEATAAQRVAELEALAAQKVADLIEEGRLIEALQLETEELRERLVGLGEWASEIDRRPLRHAIKKSLVTTRRAVFRALPLKPDQKQRLRRLFQRTPTPSLGGREATADAPSLGLMSIPGRPRYEPVPGRRDILIFAVIDWHFRFQRPQQLALSFAHRGHRVFYISNQFLDSRRPGYAIEPLDRDLPLYQVRLHVIGVPPIYYGEASEDTRAMILAGLGQLLFHYGVTGSYGIAHHPFWQPMIWRMPNCIRIYDCMDHHEGFGQVPQDLVEAEKRLLGDSDLVIVTSTWLERFAQDHNPRVALIRNAADYAFFSRRPERVYADNRGRQIIGYYGAIAEWFDAEIIRAVAKANPERLVLLIGSDTVNAAKSLADLPNVRFTGEVPYAELPHFLYGFDVCVLPFKVMPLTLATNPVKVYEYLAAGRPVVATSLPELAQFGAHVVRADDPQGFAKAVAEAINTPLTEEAIEARRAFAREQTWEHRAAAFGSAIQSIELPRISVIVLSFNNLELTRACVQSVLQRTGYPNLELILVDNGSSDGTQYYLRDLEPEHPEIKVILSETNLGFAAGNNLGLGVATGDYLVLLNNDTVVTDGWVLTLMRHLQRDPEIGIIGPVTDNIGNEARIELRYSDPAQMHEAARRFTLARIGRTFAMRTLAFFCVMLPRRTYERCGPICTDYGIGFFEDDDYCRRIEKEGWTIRCAEDVFIHHHLSASFSKLSQAERDRLFEANRAIYEKKWGPWVPHRYR